MSEKEAQQKLEELLSWLKNKYINYTEINLHDDNGAVGFIGFHMTKILTESGGKWDRNVALQYIQSLEADIIIG